MRTRLLRLAAAVLVLLAAYVGFRWLTDWRHMVSTDDAYADADVTVLSPRVAGQVVELMVQDNQAVAAGQVLARIDPRDYQARLDQARAAVAAAEALLAQLEEKDAVQQAMRDQAQAVIAAAQADVRRTSLDLRRTTTLVQDNIVSRQRYEAQAADASKASAGLRGSQAQLAAALAQLDAIAAEKLAAAAQLEQARAQARLAEIDLESTEIRAPLDGVVGNRAVRAGQYVRPGQHLLAVVPLSAVWIDANFKETQLARIHPGQPVRIAVDAFPDVELHGTVSGFAPASGARFSLLPPENATGNFTKVVQRVPVRIVLPADHPLTGRLRPGLSVVVHVDTRAAP